MKIIVLGAGKVGSNIAKNLSVQSYDVCVIDKAVSRLKKLQSEYDLAIVSGHASHPDVLKKAGIDSDTILISVTNDDEVNIVACQIAKQIFDVKKTICRLSDSSYIENISAFGKEMIDIPISPELSLIHM